jgi:hypothetical protein
MRDQKESHQQVEIEGEWYLIKKDIHSKTFPTNSGLGP